MKFSGTHWKCIAREFPMLFQFVALIFTLAYLFNAYRVAYRVRLHLVLYLKISINSDILQQNRAAIGLVG